MTISALYHYPLKSAKAFHQSTTEIKLTGIRNDRTIAVINDKNKIVTGREYPNLVKLKASLDKERLILETPSGKINEIALPSNENTVVATLFRNQVSGKLFGADATDFISSYLEGDFRLIHIGNEYRPLSEKRGGVVGEHTGFADSSPIHLINRSSLIFLNSKLESKVTLANFRPNIVVDGIQPFEEDHWQTLLINGCRFRVQELTARCIFTTIDPISAEKNVDTEPLATLAKMRSSQGMPATFGIGLVPICEGAITVGDALVIESTKTT